MRESGVLMPIFSLPSKYGIGCFSKEAFQFIEFLEKAGQKCWQILPLTPTGPSNSPYQSCSTFAGNFLFIDIEQLVHQGLLTYDDIYQYYWDNSDKIDYGQVHYYKQQLLRTAFWRSNHYGDPKFIEFCNRNRYWLDAYAEYIASRDNYYKEYYKFEQYIFEQQWYYVKSYANSKGIKIIGDLPIYVSLDSADVYSNPYLFQLHYGQPTAVAGCPPDDFSSDGQVWGNPLYDWQKHRETGFEWWVQRAKRCFELYDIVRIDHFRGLYDYYSIPYGDQTAHRGHWEYAPGKELIDTIKWRLGDVKFIAEDLGMLTPGVHDLLNYSGFPGMKILQFAFGGGSDNPYLPHNFGTNNCVVYTGTHDNDTTIGWFNKASDWEKHHLGQHIWYNNGCEGMINLAMSTRADMCIIPIQDYLGLDSYARINTPGTCSGNWEWRMYNIPSDDLAYKIKDLVHRYNR